MPSCRLPAGFADDPGRGDDDGTSLLAALIAAVVKETFFGPMAGSRTFHELAGAVPGDRVAVRLGGETDAAVGDGMLVAPVGRLTTSRATRISRGEGP